MRKRRFDPRLLEERVVKVVMLGAVGVVLGVLALLVGTILAKGAASLDLAMITTTPKGGFYLGKEGGVLNAILGSLCLATGATALALLLALPIVLALNVYLARGSWLAATARLAMDVMWGIPSIVYGVFGFMVMLAMGMRASLAAGIVTVALFELPILVRGMDEVVQMIPPELPDAAFSLGATRLQTAIHALGRQALPGLATATLLAFGRGIGDTASVLFTAGFTDRVPTSLAQPVATLPLAIFFQLGTPFPEVQGRAYASALILTAIVLVVSVLSRVAARRLSRNVVGRGAS